MGRVIKIKSMRVLETGQRGLKPDQIADAKQDQMAESLGKRALGKGGLKSK